ncbi:MAG: TonB-dependent receptor [Bryobacteraceae bacterium]
MKRLFFLILSVCAVLKAQQVPVPVTVSGHVLDPMKAAVPKAKVRATDGLGRTKAETVADDEGAYRLQVESGATYSFVVEAEGFQPVATDLRPISTDLEDFDLNLGNLQSASEVLTVTERIIEPMVDQRDQEIFKRTLFTRDDQVFQTLGAGLSLGQHAGGGKSLEVRRFGFNLDHGGTGGGLRVLVDDILQNSISGGHAHGYLGNLKALTPELVSDVSLINGPFNAAYGDFSGLGVVNIKLRDDMPDKFTARAQFGQYNTRRLFGAYSPAWEKTSAFLAYEYSYSDGPFTRPLEYLRNNITGNWLRKLSPTQSISFRIFANTNDAYAAGQVPVDEIEAGRIGRFAVIDPSDGNKVKSGTLAGYWANELKDGSQFRVNGMLNRMLFDLYSNFTFFLNDPIRGDGFGQHDSRLQEAVNAQYIKPHSRGQFFGTFTGGVNYLDNQINLKLYGRQARVPTDLRTWAQVRVANPGFYGQENIVFGGGRYRIDVGLRYDEFIFRVGDHLGTSQVNARNAGSWQPKVGFSYTPSTEVPLTFYLNYGRAITSTNARALIADPLSVLTATTDFYQFGTSHNKGRYSLATSFFWIDRANEMIYAADDGSNEFVGPSRSYGFEVKSSVQINRYLSWNGSITKVLNAFYRGSEPRAYVDRAPHFTAYTSLTMTDWKKWSGSLRMRSINHYILNGDEAQSVVSGNTVFDFSVSRNINRWFDMNFAMDNVLNKTFFETFERYTSRLPGQDPLERVHGTPGYPRTIMGGITIRLFPKAR